MSETPIHILLVEDDPAHAEIVRRSLADFHVDCRITHVTDGQAALDALDGFRSGTAAGNPRPDLILLDLRLPRVDGLDVLRQIKADEALRSIPTVVLTTSAAESDMLRAYEGGAGSYLVKPINFEQFTKMMETFGLYWVSCNRFPK